MKTGRVIVYSSKKIEQGCFVTPSYREAMDYGGGMEVNIDDVARIDTSQGQYAKVDF